MRKVHARIATASSPSATFGESLTALIEAHGASARDLAAALRIDVSLVYKWLRDERTPARKSEYLAAIDQFLGLSPIECKALHEAQARSLEYGRPKKSVPKRVASLFARVVTHGHDTLGNDAAGAARVPECNGAIASLPPAGAIDTWSAAREAALALIDRSGDPPADGGTLLLTFQSLGTGSFKSEFVTRWQHVLREALGRGWKVEHIWRLNRDVRRSVSLVVSMLDLLDAGQYHPWYFNKYEPLSPPYDLLIRPDAALLLLATDNTRTVSAGILIEGTDQVKLLTDHFAQLQSQAQPLLRSYLRDEPEFGTVLVESQIRFPGRSLVKYGLSFFTEPEAWSTPESPWTRMAYPERDIETFCRHRQQRLDAFRAHVRTHRYRDICPKQAVELLVQEGRYARYTEQQSSGQQPKAVATKAERREHLQSAIAVLKEFGNFELALLDGDETDAIPVRPGTYWEVVGADRVLINSRSHRPQGDSTEIEIAIDEPTIVAGCAAYFEQLWEGISPRNRDKEYVIWWLERQLDSLAALPD